MRIWLVFLITLLTSLAFGQFEVPKITFQDWRTIEELEDSTEYLAHFPSAFKSEYPENDNVSLTVFLPVQDDEQRAIPVVLILHYWGAPNLRVERSLAQELNRRGIGAAILTLPYHLSRTPRGATSGALAVQPDPAKLRNMMIQSTQDCIRSIDFIESRSPRLQVLGIYGTSLGALIGSLAYGVEPRLKNAAFLLGGADMAKLIWNSSRVGHVKEALRFKGFDEAKLAAELKPIDCAPYLMQKPVGRTFLVSAKYDTVVPPESSRKLNQLLPSSKTLEIETGHYGGVFIQERLLREVALFFAAVAGDRDYEPPTQLISPTIRVGVTFEVPGRYDIVGGIDLLKLDADGKTYASLLLTPRNPVFWVGRDIGNGMNVGIGISNQRVRPGVFWSTVL